MKRVHFLSVVAVAVMLFSAASFAGMTPVTTYDLVTGGGDKTDTTAFAGLKWDMDGGATPQLVLGVIRAKTDSDGDTHGGTLSMAFKLENSPGPGKLKLSFLKGKRDLQGEIGGGYDFANSKPYFSVGANASHLNGGLDVDTDGHIDPFVMLHTKGKFDRNDGTRCVSISGPTGAYTDPDCTNPVPSSPL